MLPSRVLHPACDRARPGWPSLAHCLTAANHLPLSLGPTGPVPDRRAMTTASVAGELPGTRLSDEAYGALRPSAALWAGTSVLITNRHGQVLVQYVDCRDTCLLPGGAIDKGESPRPLGRPRAHGGTRGHRPRFIRRSPPGLCRVLTVGAAPLPRGVPPTEGRPKSPTAWRPRRHSQPLMTAATAGPVTAGPRAAALPGRRVRGDSEPVSPARPGPPGGGAASRRPRGPRPR